MNIEESLRNQLEAERSARMALRSQLAHIAGVAKAFSHTAKDSNLDGFKAIESKIDNALKTHRERA